MSYLHLERYKRSTSRILIVSRDHHIAIIILSYLTLPEDNDSDIERVKQIQMRLIIFVQEISYCQPLRRHRLPPSWAQSILIRQFRSSLAPPPSTENHHVSPDSPPPSPRHPSPVHTAETDSPSSPSSPNPSPRPPTPTSPN